MNRYGASLPLPVLHSAAKQPGKKISTAPSQTEGCPIFTEEKRTSRIGQLTYSRVSYWKTMRRVDVRKRTTGLSEVLRAHLSSAQTVSLQENDEYRRMLLLEATSTLAEDRITRERIARKCVPSTLYQEAIALAGFDTSLVLLKEMGHGEEVSVVEEAVAVCVHRFLRQKGSGFSVYFSPPTMGPQTVEHLLMKRNNESWKMACTLLHQIILALPRAQGVTASQQWGAGGGTLRKVKAFTGHSAMEESELARVLSCACLASKVAFQHTQNQRTFCFLVSLASRWFSTSNTSPLSSQYICGTLQSCPPQLWDKAIHFLCDNIAHERALSMNHYVERPEGLDPGKVHTTFCSAIARYGGIFPILVAGGKWDLVLELIKTTCASNISACSSDVMEKSDAAIAIFSAIEKGGRNFVCTWQNATLYFASLVSATRLAHEKFISYSLKNGSWIPMASAWVQCLRSFKSVHFPGSVDKCGHGELLSLWLATESKWEAAVALAGMRLTHSRYTPLFAMCAALEARKTHVIAALVRQVATSRQCTVKQIAFATAVAAMAKSFEDQQKVPAGNSISITVASLACSQALRSQETFNAFVVLTLKYLQSANRMRDGSSVASQDVYVPSCAVRSPVDFDRARLLPQLMDLLRRARHLVPCTDDENTISSWKCAIRIFRIVGNSHEWPLDKLPASVLASVGPEAALMCLG